MPTPHLVPIFRIIHVDNLEVCLKRGGIYAPLHSPEDGLQYRTIHNNEIQTIRKIHPIPCGTGGTIHDYVPFYFGPLSPMLFQLHTGMVSGYTEGEEPILYLVTTVESILGAKLQYVFSDGHGIASYTEWFDQVDDLDKVDWEAVYAHYWHDTLEDNDIQRRKQAEFLGVCPSNSFSQA